MIFAVRVGPSHGMLPISSLTRMVASGCVWSRAAVESTSLALRSPEDTCRFTSARARRAATAAREPGEPVDLGRVHRAVRVVTRSPLRGGRPAA